MTINRRFAVVAFILAACTSEEQPPASTFTESDSSGITIATNTAPAESLVAAWTVDPTPLVRIGSVGGNEASQFNDLMGVLLSDAGDIIVANGDPPEIRIFDSTGKFIAKQGRRGDGPGEFASLDILFAGAGDTVFAVQESFKSVINRYSTRTGFIDASTLDRATIMAALPSGFVGSEGISQIFADGAMVIGASEGVRVNYDNTPSGQPFRPISTAVWMSADRTRSKVLGDIPDLEQIFVATGGDQRRIVMPLAARRSATGVSTKHPSRFCFTTNDLPEVHCVNADGTRRIIRWNQTPAKIPAEAIEEWKDRLRKSAARPNSPTTPAIAEKMIDAGLIHDTFAPVNHIFVTADQSVLVMTSDLGTPRDTVFRFRAFSEKGQLLGTITFPPKFWPGYITTDRVVGMTVDADGVQYVVMYRLLRAPAK